MQSSEGDFWDQRYRAEGAIWGEQPSPTAQLSAQHAPAGGQVLEVGFGYGRDLAFLLRQQFHVTGVELSAEGHRQAIGLLRRERLKPEGLVLGKFEDSPFLPGTFDAVICHRMAHLLIRREAVTRFATKVHELLRPGGFLCLGAQHTEDLNTTAMIHLEDQVYEYKDRPGHRIRYWNDTMFRVVFEGSFRVLALNRAIEVEALSHPLPCRLTIMLAQKKETP